MEKEKMGLSKREKRLIYVAVCFGMLVIMVVLVILPLNYQLINSNSEHDELATKYSQIQVALATEERIRAGYDNALALFEHMRMTYESETLSSDIGRMLTQKVKEHNLTPISQTISHPEDFIIPDDDEDEKEDDEAVFSTMSVSMAVSGDYHNVKRLVDTIGNNNYIRISNASITFIENDFGGVSTDKINIRFEIIMLKTSEDEEEEEIEDELAGLLDL